MKRWTLLAIVFSVLSFGAIQETLRIFSSSDADIANDRNSLLLMAVVITGLFIFLALLFWIRSSRQK